MVCEPMEDDPPVIAHYYLSAPSSNYLAGRLVSFKMTFAPLVLTPVGVRLSQVAFQPLTRSPVLNTGISSGDTWSHRLWSLCLAASYIG